jgi:hypothetical protein
MIPLFLEASSISLPEGTAGGLLTTWWEEELRMVAWESFRMLRVLEAALIAMLGAMFSLKLLILELKERVSSIERVCESRREIFTEGNGLL